MDHNARTYHIPALLEDAVNLLVTDSSGIYVDATFGGGGHSRGILAALNAEGRLFGFDRDMDAYANRPDDCRFEFIHSNFRHIRNFMKFHGIEKVDGILADLGVSFHHFDTAERGFSFREDAPLDMRMNRNAPLSAAMIIAETDEEKLTKIFKEFTDLKKPGIVAKAIIRNREESPIETTGQLVKAVEGVIDPRQMKKDLAQVFQALRIATNHETDDLARFLESTTEILKPGGRLAILTYHSIEDRMVKNFLKTGKVAGEIEKDFYGNINSPWIAVTRKPIEPSANEIEANPRSRSAKLRVAQLKG